MGAQQLLEGLGLGLAELGEARGSVPHGTVMLTQLRAGIRVDRGGGVAVLGETRCQQREPSADILRIRQGCLMARDERLRT